MQVERLKSNDVRIGTMSTGSLFEYIDDIYIRTTLNECVYGIDVSTGNAVQFVASCLVEPKTNNFKLVEVVC